MQLIRRGLSLVLACLVLIWAGAAFADDCIDAAEDLADYMQSAEQFHEEADPLVLDLHGADPQDCPALSGGIPLPVLHLVEVRPEAIPPVWHSVLPQPAAPPPRNA
ncbi:MAG: hypothetical protein JSS57_09750 [Proteobacteria bacterium]|nr:hypothetical protein [Pseudomonadota bacterium]RTL34499.1 MAG: hypothetical protein EKK49_08555 [Rhodocyclaceae bacterium]